MDGRRTLIRPNNSESRTFRFNWVLELIGTWLGLGLGVFGTCGLGPGLDKSVQFLRLWSDPPPLPTVKYNYLLGDFKHNLKKCKKNSAGPPQAFLRLP